MDRERYIKERERQTHRDMNRERRKDVCVCVWGGVIIVNHNYSHIKIPALTILTA